MGKSKKSAAAARKDSDALVARLGEIPDASYLAYFQRTPKPFDLLTSGHFPAGVTTSGHSHPCVALHGCLEGPIVLQADADRHTLDAGSFLVMPPGMSHCWLNESRHTCATVGLLIDTDQPGQWPPLSGVDGFCAALAHMEGRPRRFDAAGDPELQQSFWLVAEHLTSDTAHDPAILAGALLTLAGQICGRLREKPTADAHLSDARRIRQLLLARVCDRLSIAEISEVIGIGPTRAKEIFRNAFGCGIMHYFNQLKIAQAKRFLCDPSLTVEQVSRKVGFATPSYFHRAFLKHTGETPRAFRSHPSHKRWQ